MSVIDSVKEDARNSLTAPNPKKTKARRSCRRLIGFGSDKLNKHPTDYAVGCLFSGQWLVDTVVSTVHFFRDIL